MTSLGHREDWSMEQEPRIRMDQQVLKVLDLVMTKGRVALVINVVICFEFSSNTVEAMVRCKQEKYEGLATAIKRRSPGVRSVHTFGFPMAARGKWYDGNGHVLRWMGLGTSKIKKVAKILSKMGLL